MEDGLLSMRQVAKLLNLTPHTLRMYDKQLEPLRTAGNHRRYRQEKVDEFMGREITEIIEEKKPYASYSRVSTVTQNTRGDLQRQSDRIQEYCTQNNYEIGYTIKDTGSGLNDTRRGFLYLTELVLGNKISGVVVEHRDRLSRFQFNFIKTMFKSHGCEIIVIDDKVMTDEQELTMDMMSLLASFSGKYYSRRRHRKNVDKYKE